MTPPFFIGWERRPVPRPMRLVAAGLVLAFLALAALLAATADEPAATGFALLPGQAAPASLPSDVALQGVLTLHPYPLLHLPPDAAHPRGRAVLLAGDGKTGLPGDLTPLAGQRVSVEGFVLQRGSIAMVATGATPLPVPGEAPAPLVEDLGRWRIAGEICDGKCAAGAMRPGIGLSHRACATLCLQGDIPAVFVANAPVAGSAFLLLADQQGRSGFAAFRDLIGLRVVLEGRVERRGDMLVFLAELDRARLP